MGVWGVGELLDRGSEYYVGLGLIFLLGGGFLGMYAAYFIGTDPSVWFVLSGLLIPVLISLFLLGIGVWIVLEDIEGRYVLLIGEWSLMATMTFFGFGLLNIVFQRTAGGVVVFPLFSTITTAATGLLLGMIIGLHDSRRKLNRDRLETAHDRAERLGQRLTVLNRVLRHDIRNAVNVIRGHAERLLEGGDGVESSARTILAKSDEMHRLSEKARLLERMLERDDEPLETVDITAVLEEKAERVERAYPGVEVETDLPDSVSVVASPLIDFAFENVIENAIEHNDTGSPRVRIEATTAVGDGDTAEGYVEVRVADDGPGIPADEIAALERGDETELEHTSGLGLWLVCWIVRESAGDIEFEENDPRGSVVSIRLRREPAPPEA